MKLESEAGSLVFCRQLPGVVRWIFFSATQAGTTARASELRHRPLGLFTGTADVHLAPATSAVLRSVDEQPVAVRGITGLQATKIGRGEQRRRLNRQACDETGGHGFQRLAWAPAPDKPKRGPH